MNYPEPVHSPAPWTCETYAVISGVYIIPEVVQREREMHRLTSKEEEANTFLIAAAPEMLEALLSIIRGFDSGEFVLYPWREEMVRFAISKALRPSLPRTQPLEGERV